MPELTRFHLVMSRRRSRIPALAFVAVLGLAALVVTTAGLDPLPASAGRIPLRLCGGLCGTLPAVRVASSASSRSAVYA